MAESTRPVIKFQPNETYLSTLCDLGISRKKAIKALKYVNNRSVDEAATFIFETEIHSSSSSSSESEQLLSAEDLQAATGQQPLSPYKMVFVVNCELNMNTGKIAAQVAHAAVDLYSTANMRDSIHNLMWQQNGQIKIVLRGKDENDLSQLEKQARQQDNHADQMFTTLIYDAGRTEVAPNSLTCLGLYGTVDDVDKITGHLKLLKTCTKCE